MNTCKTFEIKENVYSLLISLHKFNYDQTSFVYIRLPITFIYSAIERMHQQIELDQKFIQHKNFATLTTIKLYFYRYVSLSLRVEELLSL